jgi:uncharacterized protein YecA (UPF0149 family)
MTPDQILHAFETADGLPREAMAAARERREEMIPLFLEHIERLQRATDETLADADCTAFLFVFFLLGEWRDPRAYRPLARLLHRDSAYLDDILGDIVTDGAARVIAGVFDGDLTPITDVIEDDDADAFARAAMLDALVIIARAQPAARLAVEQYLRRFHSSDVDGPSILWSSWALAAADLGLADLASQVRIVVEDEQLIDPMDMDFPFFQAQLDDAIRNGASTWYHGAFNTTLIGDAIEELSRLHCYAEPAQKSRVISSRPLSVLEGMYGGDTFVRGAPRVGRNDPCPCGSGQKFKKCCLQ